MSNADRNQRRSGISARQFVSLGILIGGIAGIYAYASYADPKSEIDMRGIVSQVASRGAFDEFVLEEGEIESAKSVDIVCKVTTGMYDDGVQILWVIDEGTWVEPGDKVIQLDATNFEQLEKEQKLLVSEKESAVANAQALLAQATITRQEYVEGTFLSEESAIVSQQAIAEQDLQRAKQALASSKRLEARGLIKPLQVEADMNAVRNAEDRRDSAEQRLSVLRQLTKPKMLVQFDTDIKTNQSTLDAAQFELEEARQKLALARDELTKSVMYAPSAGRVVYANEYRGRGGNGDFVVEPGADVREEQVLLRLPDPTQMRVRCKVRESRVTSLQSGMPARITVDAIPGMELQGVVTKVNDYAEPNSPYGSSSIKRYITDIKINDPPAELRSGMTAKVKIFVQQLDDGILIPIEALYEHGGQMYSLIQRGPKKFETVRVTIGASDETTASILSGLSENEKVVLNLRDYRELMDLPVLQPEDTTEFRELRSVAAVIDTDQGPNEN